MPEEIKISQEIRREAEKTIEALKNIGSDDGKSVKEVYDIGKEKHLSQNFVENQETRDFIKKVLKEDREETVNIVPKEAARKIMTEKKLEILHTLDEKEVSGVRDLAGEIDRDPGQVTKDLKQLWQYGLMDYEKNGRKKEPVRTADKIVIEPF